MATSRKPRGSTNPSGHSAHKMTLPFKVNYSSMPVEIPDSFLAPLLDPSVIKVSKIAFEKFDLPEYKALFAVVLDNVLSQEECNQLLHMAEMSSGAHRDDVEGPENNGWRPALVNVGHEREMMVSDYRNSDRIIWDQETVVRRLWERVLQGEGMKEYFSVLEGDAYAPVGVVASRKWDDQGRWVVTGQGLNERMRFLRYGPGQFFKEHCDGMYVTPDGLKRSFYTYHLYMNDSAEALGIPKPSDGKEGQQASKNNEPELLRGGSTPFYSADMTRRLDVNPKAGRVLIFQHRRLLHSGDEVTAGVKYTMRSDVMFERDSKPM